MPTQDGYPTESELETIRAWRGQDLRGWFDAIKAAWWMPEWGWSEVVTPTQTIIRASTGGWSGNEEIINVMSAHVLWVITWESSRRGGHYTFQWNTPFHI